MDQDGKLTLHIWKGDFGLVSLHLESLQVVTYCKMANIPITLVQRTFPIWKFGWAMPVLGNIHTEQTDLSEIIEYLRSNDEPSDDKSLNSLQCGETLAFLSMLESKLYPAIQFLWWLDVQNFEGLSRKWHWHSMPFPLNYFYVKSRKARTSAFIDSMFPMDDDVEFRKRAVYKSCVECFATVDTRLNGNSFFYGNTATFIDAVLYSYLAPIIKVPFPSDELKKALVQNTGIVGYVERIDKQFFPEYSYRDRYGLCEPTSDVENDALSVPNMIMAAAMVSFTMLAYGVSHGIIPLPRILGRYL